LGDGCRKKGRVGGLTGWGGYPFNAPTFGWTLFETDFHGD